jgi:hypothetical protein
MAEEIGAQKRYTYDNFLTSREDIHTERAGNGRALFRFYQDAISLSGRLRSVRTRNIDTLPQLHSSHRLQALERRRRSYHRREPQQRCVYERLHHRKGSAGDSRRPLERDLQQRCCDLRRSEYRQQRCYASLRRRSPRVDYPCQRFSAARQTVTASSSRLCRSERPGVPMIQGMNAPKPHEVDLHAAGDIARYGWRCPGSRPR